MNELISTFIIVAAGVAVIANCNYTFKFYRSYETQIENLETRLKALETPKRRVPRNPPKTTLGPASTPEQALIQLDKLVEETKQ